MHKGARLYIFKLICQHFPKSYPKTPEFSQNSREISRKTQYSSKSHYPVITGKKCKWQAWYKQIDLFLQSQKLVNIKLDFCQTCANFYQLPSTRWLCVSKIRDWLFLIYGRVKSSVLWPDYGKNLPAFWVFMGKILEFLVLSSCFSFVRLEFSWIFMKMY